MTKAEELTAIAAKPLELYQCKYDFGRERIYLMMPIISLELDDPGRIEYGLTIEKAEQLAGSLMSALIAYQREQEFHNQLRQMMDNIRAGKK